jgi:hypothetical protein
MTTSMRRAAAILALGLLAACGASSSNPPPPPVIPAAPTGVVATPGDGQVTLSWTASSGATSYNAYYGTSANVSKAIGTKAAGVTSGGAVTGLTNGITYYFVVTAVNASGESAESTPAAAATPAGPAVHTFDGTWVVCRNDGGPGTTDYREIFTIAGAGASIDLIGHATADLSCDGDGTLAGPQALTAVYGPQVSAGLGAGTVLATQVDLTAPPGPKGGTFYTLLYRDTAANPDALHIGNDSPPLDGSTPALRPISLQSMARALQSAPAIADADGDWRSCPATDGEILIINLAAGTFDYTHYSGPCTGNVLYHSAGTFTVAGPVYASLGGTTVTALAVNLAETVPVAGNRFVTIWVDTSTTPRRLHQGNDTIHGMNGSTASLRPRVLFDSFLVKQ